MARTKPQIDAYKDTEISTANQGKLIVMLYDGAIRFLKTAMDNLHPRSYDVVNTNIIKAQDIVTELMLSLNLEQGGEIAENLFSLYAYMKKRLLEGNIKKDQAILSEITKLLEQLRGAWDEVAGKEAGKPEPARANYRDQGVSFSIRG
ncbi:MAG: flagellar export chaperone FliS [Spirochaetia bacterium]|nr:flagellar export chaperone FliS [Spirochaetia bacterium]